MLIYDKNNIFFNYSYNYMINYYMVHTRMTVSLSIHLNTSFVPSLLLDEAIYVSDVIMNNIKILMRI